MSIKVMTYVWDGFPGAGSELLAMLALADWCNDHGGSLYPSVAAVAEKVRVGEKHARNILHKFIKDGFLAVVANPHGGKPGTTRHYRLNVAKLKALADAKAEQEIPVFETAPLEVTPHLQFRDGSPAVTKTAPLEVTLSTIEPPVEPPLKNKNTRQCVLPDGFMPNKTAEAMASEMGLDIAAELSAFQDHHAANGSTFKDWQAAFRTWLRNAVRFARREVTSRPEFAASGETAYQRSMRERVAEVAPAIARKAPGTPPPMQAVEFFNTVKPAPALRIESNK